MLGVGNSLLGDDGLGLRVIEAMHRDALENERLRLLDGGTLGLSLLPAIEGVDAVIVVDAGELGEAPGTVRVFEGEAVEAHLAGTRRNVHEVAVADLFSAARFAGTLPARRALVVVQPSSTEWGLALTRDVAAAVPGARERILRLFERWRDETH